MSTPTASATTVEAAILRAIGQSAIMRPTLAKGAGDHEPLDHVGALVDLRDSRRACGARPDTRSRSRSRRARVIIPPASEPASGSDRAKAGDTPRMRSGAG